jgi:hypothetical protein
MDRLKIFMLAISFMTLVGCTKKPDFIEFTPEGTNIIAQMPKPTKYETKDMEAYEDGKVTAHIHSASYDDVNYHLQYQTYTGEMQEERDYRRTYEAMNLAVAKMTELTGATVDRSGGVTMPYNADRLMGMAAEMTSPDGKTKLLVRMFPMDDMVLLAMVTYPAKGTYYQGVYAQRFIESVHVR